MKVLIYGQSSLLQHFVLWPFRLCNLLDFGLLYKFSTKVGPWCALKKLSWWKIAESVSLLPISKMYILAFFFLVSNASPVSCCNSEPIPRTLAIIVLKPFRFVPQ